MQTPENRYDQLTDRVSALYDEGLQQVALDLLDTADAELQPWTAELAHLRACLLGSIGESTQALVALQQASEAGGWWEESILTEDDDLTALQYLPAFQAIVELSRARKVVAEDPPLIALPESGKPGGVVVALHGAGQRATHAMRDWAGVLDLGYALVGVESSQLMSPMYRTWPDPAQSAKDVARALDHLPAELRDLPLIAAGFSAGGRIALNWALEAEPVPTAGVVVVGPALRVLPEQAQQPLAPATILIGTADELLEVVDDAAARLTSFGITIERVPGLAHEFPQDFAARLGSVLPSCG
ncbi:dienelactone hydrolase family protein [Kribbella sp. CA-293567]|uniref:dienelactone hydrolase family protein n=1 Tax=Kribbella sp. CA-293567 TaxID=3002436 RepID=UPI0022DD1F9A|nr:alpha/beta hydrolase [Kribbella sp. CA-293567]WBQ05431.1 alpha/beta hydrolase [Kribbella sp. CA-293567]